MEGTTPACCCFQVLNPRSLPGVLVYLDPTGSTTKRFTILSCWHLGTVSLQDILMAVTLATVLWAGLGRALVKSHMVSLHLVFSPLLGLGF